MNMDKVTSTSRTSEALALSFRRTPIGEIVVAATAAGVRAILIGDDRESLTRDVHARFPDALVRAHDASSDRFADDVVRLIESPSTSIRVPLDIAGTPFQRSVWSLLQTICAGETTSYSEIATRLGNPRAVRAVARACATNPIAFVIPCHRVLRSDGGISGYRWGVERKRAMLAREASADR